MQKVVVIGVDGATPDLIDKWIKEDKLPNFKKIRENGVWGKLKSTMPPFSAPAWTSIVTGCNPGKHGIYGFGNTDIDNPHMVSSRFRKAPAIWNFLTDINLSSIVVNVPVTYPPEKINGVMITGLLTPSAESDFTYPRNIKEKLKKDELGEYELEQIWLEDFPRSYLAKHAPEKLLKIITDQMVSRERVTTNIMKNLDWDFTMVVFRGTDTAQHFLFDKKELLLECYKKVDQLVGKMIKKFPDAVFFIVSDHGFEEIKKILNTDNVLYNANLIQLSKDPHDHPFQTILYFIFAQFMQILRFIPYRTIKKSYLIKKILFSGASFEKIIDFSKTKATSAADGRGIIINQKGRYKLGIVEPYDYDKLCKKIKLIFKKLRDSDTGEKIIEEVYDWKEVYGENAIYPPDLLLKFCKGYTALSGIRGLDNISNIVCSNNKNIPFLFKEDPASRSGDHAQYGVFFAYGKNIKQGFVTEDMSVSDILPTVFASMKIPIPLNIDGNVYESIFIDKLPIEHKNYQLNKQKLSKLELEKIRQLKKL